jgi:hypothetical protein
MIRRELRRVKDSFLGAVYARILDDPAFLPWRHEYKRNCKV